MLVILNFLVTSMQIAYAFAYLVISAGFAFAASLYAPPGFAQVRMMRALQRVENVEMKGTVSGQTPFEGLRKFSAQGNFGMNIKQAQGMFHAQGSIANVKGDTPFQGDVVARDGKEYVRLSYLPLKIINNQWIEIPGSMVWAEPISDLFFQMHFTKHLSAVRKDGMRFAQYAFEVNAPRVAGKGIVLVDPKTYLPYAMSGAFTAPGGAGEIALQVSSYNRPMVVVETPSYVRPAPEVLEQLARMEKRAEAPVVLPLLSVPNPRLDFFTRDSDHDGLPDAVEQMYGTDPKSPDTDNDTYLDGDEVLRGYNPSGGGNL